jgi:alpha-L-rhamnosidase
MDGHSPGVLGGRTGFQPQDGIAYLVPEPLTDMKRISLLGSLLLVAALVPAQVRVSQLRCENLLDPMGIETPAPRLSWQLQSDVRNTRQTAWEVRVAHSIPDLVKGRNLVWSSGRQTSDASVHVPYAGTPLAAGRRYHWQVRVWDGGGQPSAWSTAATWQMGLPGITNLGAAWIGAGYPEEKTGQPSPYLRKSFRVDRKIRSATAYISALGMYEAWLNGKRIGDACLTPGWTAYRTRVQYQSYDVTSLLAPGDNAVGAILGNGWYRGFIGFSGQNNFYGKEAGLLLRLDIEYTDGTSAQVLSDGSWTSADGSIRNSEIYNGETVDARLEPKGWCTPAFDASAWKPVSLLKGPFPALVSTWNEPVKKHETFKPLKIITTPKGEKVIDFGQNLVGWVRLTVRGNRNDTIRISHAEVLDKAGNFYTDNLRAAKQQNHFVLAGGGAETFEPHFTFQGFRFIRIEGYRGELRAEDFEAVALYSDMRPTGSFQSSHPLINQLQHNIQWGQRGNFLDVPTDCPQRDERLGWTGDAQAFARTATFNFQVNAFFSKWLRDLEADQLPDGAVPHVIPNVLGDKSSAACGWADAATIIPWTMYIAYGDRRILEQQYTSMKAWVGYMEKQARNDLWNTGFHFGDWLFYTMCDDNSGRAAVSDKYLLAQAFYCHSVTLLLKTAKVLGRTEDIAYYEALRKRVVDAFNREYVSPNGRVSSNTQTVYTLALHFDLLPENLRQQAADRLAENIQSYNNHITTGFLGTPYICHVLSRFGHADVAFKLLMQETYPSWLYPVKMGATTIWERWNGIRPDGSFEVPSMNSFNHYAYGAIGDWMYRTLAGLDTDESAPGYKRLIVKPHVGGGLTHAEASLETNYGKASSGWRIDGDSLEVTVTVPANTGAVIHLPAKSPASISEGGRLLSAAGDVKVIGTVTDRTIVETGSGTYRFRMRK